MYIGGEDGVFYALELATGAVAWRFVVKRLDPNGTKDTRICTKPVLDHKGRRLFFGSNTGVLWALDAQTGKQLWSQQAAAGRADDYASPAIAAQAGLVFWGNDKGSADQNNNTSGSFYAVDASSGAVRWQREVGGSVSCSPLVAEQHGLVFVGAPMEGSLHGGGGSPAMLALNLSTGATVWQYSTASIRANGISCRGGITLSEKYGLVIFPACDCQLHAVHVTNGLPAAPMSSGATAGYCPGCC
eukprot:SAG22_NODE_643_length_8222_cov_5.448972_6_plen_244_part_00